MTTGELIKQARIRRKMSQRELAEKLGVSASMIGQYESDLRNPKLDTLQRIANALDVPINTLTNGVHTIEIPMPEYAMRMPTKEEISRMSPAEQEYYSLRLLADTMPELLVQELTKAYQELNKLGQVESVIRVRELTQCTKYTESDPNNAPLKITVQFSDQENQNDNKNPPQD